MNQPDLNATSASNDGNRSGTDGDSTHDLTGRTIGDFFVERLLGQGGMGEVYLARQISLNRPVALKVLREILSTNPTYLSRFEVEATAVARLNHPNIVQVYTLGTEGGLRFIAMEYVQGTNLKEYLIKKGSVDLNLGLSIMRQTAQAIDAAGEIGLIHRDIKPENLLLTRKGQVKVADFGLVREQGSEGLNLTQEGVTLGTPMYMSPEQVQGKALDPRSDLYSMGVTFYHMFAGVTPFRGESALAVALKHVQESPVNLAVHRPDLPPSLIAVVMKLLEKDPARRFSSAKELLRELARIKESLSPSQVGLGSVTEIVSVPSKLPAASVDTQTRRFPRANPFRNRLPSIRPSKGVMVVATMIGMLAGGWSGWLARTPDLLGVDAPKAKGPACLWIEPRWVTIPRQASPRDQLRFAQLLARDSDRVAAYLAIAGHFPGEVGWTQTGYIHLARHLLTRGDSTRLGELSSSLNESSAEALRQLATIASAGVDALENRAAESRDRLTSLSNIGYLDPPGLAEFALEVVEVAQSSPSGAAMSGDPWTNLRNDLLGAIGIESPDRPDPLEPPRRAIPRQE